MGLNMDYGVNVAIHNEGARGAPRLLEQRIVLMGGLVNNKNNTFIRPRRPIVTPGLTSQVSESCEIKESSSILTSGRNGKVSSAEIWKMFLRLIDY